MITQATYGYKNREFYTGTSQKPDAIQIFIKENKDDKILMRNMLPLENFLGMLPVCSIFTGAVRVIKAVKALFIELHKGNFRSPDVKIALKNLFQGIAEMIPLTGLFLMACYSFKALSCEKRIEAELRDREHVAGIAVEGKVVALIKMDDLDKRLVKGDHSVTNNARIALLDIFCQGVLQHGEKKSRTIAVSELCSHLPKIVARPIAE